MKYLITLRILAALLFILEFTFQIGSHIVKALQNIMAEGD